MTTVYVVFEVHYNRRIDMYSHKCGKPMKSSKVKSTPMYMCDGSLKHALTWCKYHMEHNKYYCNLHGYQLITEGELDTVVYKNYGQV